MIDVVCEVGVLIILPFGGFLLLAMLGIRGGWVGSGTGRPSG